MIDFPLTPYSDTESEALVNEYQDQLDALSYAATAKRYDIPAYVVFPIPDDLVAAFDAANAAKKLVMIDIAKQVMSNNTATDFNTAYHAIYDPLYP
jgi:hypothetical protein